MRIMIALSDQRSTNEGKRSVSSLVNITIKSKNNERAFQSCFCMHKTTLIQNIRRHIQLKHAALKCQQKFCPETLSHKI